MLVLSFTLGSPEISIQNNDVLVSKVNLSGELGS